MYAFTENSEKICYMASEPKKQEGDYTRRGNPAVLVTRRPGPKVVDEVSVQPGYSYKEGSEVQVGVGQEQVRVVHPRRARLDQERGRRSSPDQRDEAGQ